MPQPQLGWLAELVISATHHPHSEVYLVAVAKQGWVHPLTAGNAKVQYQ